MSGHTPLGDRFRSDETEREIARLSRRIADLERRMLRVKTIEAGGAGGGTTAPPAEARFIKYMDTV